MADAARQSATRHTRVYAGIGSRHAPDDVLREMEMTAKALAEERWVLRSGMSPGADRAFYAGALAGGGPIELFLPWPGFQAAARILERERHVLAFSRPTEAAYALAKRFSSGWQELEEGRRHLLARDGHQVLGHDLDSPAALVICWTPSLPSDHSEDRAHGTGQALRIAEDRHITVLNFARERDHRRIRELRAPRRNRPPTRGQSSGS